VNPPDDFGYEARYGWNRRSATVIGVAVVFCIFIAILPTVFWLRIICWGVFGLGAVVIMVSMATGAIALRVDASGITACSRPFPPRRSRFYPWHDVRAIMIWRFRRMRIIGFAGHPGAAPLLGQEGGQTAVLAMMSRGIPRDVAATGLAVNGWALATDDLRAAVAHFAPDVEIIDTTVR
jgi:hypothetical protein